MSAAPSTHRRLPGRDHVVRSFALSCPECARFTETRVGTPARDAPKEVACAGCRRTRTLDWLHHFGPNAVLDGCPACGYHTLYAQRDMNGRLGVIVVVAVYAALLLSGLPLPWMVAALLAFTLLDVALLLFVVRRVLICYRCKSQWRGFPPGPSCRPFDLATWEAHAGTGS